MPKSPKSKSAKVKDVTEYMNRLDLEEEDYPIDVLDCATVKRTLDERVSKIVEEGMEYPEDHLHGNVQLALMTLSCVVACVTQLYPEDRPEALYVGMSGPIVFFALSVLTQLLYTFWDKDFIMFTYPNKGNGIALQIRSKMPRYQDLYKCIIQIRPSATAAIVHSAEMEHSVGRYFSEDGMIDNETLCGDILELVQQLEQKKSN